MSEWDAVIIGTGPAGATAAEVLTAAGWSVLMLEKGRNHLLALEPPFGPLGHVSNDEIKFMRRHFLGPDPLLEPRTFRRSDADGDRLDVGDVNNLPSTVGGGGFHADGKLPRFREVDFKPARAPRARRGRRHRRLAGRLRRDGAVLRRGRAPRRRRRRGRREPVRGVARRSVPDAAGPDMFCAVLTDRRRDPDSATTRTARRPASTAWRTTAGPRATTAGSAGTSAARSTPRAIRSRRCATRCAPGAARSAPSRASPRCCSTAPGAARRGVRYLDGELATARSVGPARGPRGRRVRDPAAAAAHRAREPGRRRPVPHVPLPDVRARHVPVPPARPPRPVGHPPHGRPDRARCRRHGRGARRGSARSSAAASSSTARPATRSWKAIHLPPRRTAFRADDASRRRATAWPSFTMQGEDLPQATNRIDLDPHVRDVYGLPAGPRHVLAPSRTRSCAPQHWAPRLEAIMREAGAEHTFWTTSPPIVGSMADRPGRSHADLASHHGQRAHGRRSRARACSTGGSDLHGVENVICTDSSVFPTSTGYGPTLTIVALAIRASRALAGLDPLRSARPRP